MKRKILIGLAALLLLGGGIAMAESDKTDRSFDGNTVDCYSSSSFSSGASYYDCGSCTRQQDARGTGRSRTCAAGASGQN